MRERRKTEGVKGEEEEEKPLPTCIERLFSSVGLLESCYYHVLQRTSLALLDTASSRACPFSPNVLICYKS